MQIYTFVSKKTKKLPFFFNIAEIYHRIIGLFSLSHEQN